MRQVFLVLLKKNFWFGWGVCLGEARKMGVFCVFWPILTGPGRQSNAPKLWPKKHIFSPNSGKSENAWVSHWRLVITCHNSPPEDASELYEPLKDSWSLLIGTENKNILDLGSGFSVGGLRKRGVLAFFCLFHYDVITSTKGQNFGSKFGCILGWNMKP